MRKKKKRGKLTKAERRAIALRNLSKAHRGRKKSKKSGYHPRKLSRRRFKKKRVGIKRFGRSRGKKVKVLTTGEHRRRRGRRRKKNPWYGQPRRHAKAAKKGWRRRKRKGGGGRKRRSRMRAYRSGAAHDTRS